MLASQGQVSGMPVGGAAGPCSCGLAPQTDCDLALALMHFSPKSSGCHCLLHFPLNSHLPSLTATWLPQLPQGRQALSEDLTQVTEPFPSSKGKVLGALFQENCCNKPFSLAWDSVLSFLCTLLTCSLQNFCLFLIKSWMYWAGICTY